MYTFVCLLFVVCCHLHTSCGYWYCHPYTLLCINSFILVLKAAAPFHRTNTHTTQALAISHTSTLPFNYLILLSYREIHAPFLLHIYLVVKPLNRLMDVVVLHTLPLGLYTPWGVRCVKPLSSSLP